MRLAATAESFWVGPYLSYQASYRQRMKLCLLTWHTRNEGETLAIFGNARLVKKHDGKTELLGGSHADRAAAREWCSLFMHEAVFAFSSPPKSTTRPRSACTA